MYQWFYVRGDYWCNYLSMPKFSCRVRLLSPILKTKSLGILLASHLTVFYLHPKWLRSQVTMRGLIENGDVCRLFGAKPLHEQMLTYWTLIWTLGIKRQCNVNWNPTILIHVMTGQLSPTRGSFFIRPAVCHVHSDRMPCLPSRERKLPPFNNRRILLSIRQKRVVTWLNFTVCHRCQGSEPIDREKHQCNSTAGKLKSDISSHLLSKRLQSIIRHNT